MECDSIFRESVLKLGGLNKDLTNENISTSEKPGNSTPVRSSSKCEGLEELLSVQ